MSRWAGEGGVEPGIGLARRGLHMLLLCAPSPFNPLYIPDAVPVVVLEFFHTGDLWLGAKWRYTCCCHCCRCHGHACCCFAASLPVALNDAAWLCHTWCRIACVGIGVGMDAVVTSLLLPGARGAERLVPQACTRALVERQVLAPFPSYLACTRVGTDSQHMFIVCAVTTGELMMQQLMQALTCLAALAEGVAASHAGQPPLGNKAGTPTAGTAQAAAAAEMEAGALHAAAKQQAAAARQQLQGLAQKAKAHTLRFVSLSRDALGGPVPARHRTKQRHDRVVTVQDLLMQLIDQMVLLLMADELRGGPTAAALSPAGSALITAVGQQVRPGPGAARCGHALACSWFSGNGHAMPLLWLPDGPTVPAPCPPRSGSACCACATCCAAGCPSALRCARCPHWTSCFASWLLPPRRSCTSCMHSTTPKGPPLAHGRQLRRMPTRSRVGWAWTQMPAMMRSSRRWSRCWARQLRSRTGASWRCCSPAPGRPSRTSPPPCGAALAL